jgi:hypothetical protein
MAHLLRVVLAVADRELDMQAIVLAIAGKQARMERMPGVFSVCISSRRFVRYRASRG